LALGFLGKPLKLGQPAFLKGIACLNN